MFNIRIKQLSRRINDPNFKSGSETIRLLHKKIINDINESKYEQLYNVLTQVNILAQIFARAIANIAAEDLTEKSLFQIEMCNKFAEFLISELSKQDISYPLTKDKFPFSQSDFNKLSEDLRPIKKNKNQQLTTIEHILQYLIDKEYMNLPQINELNSWNDLLSYIFGANVANRAEGVEKIEQIHIKEQILANKLKGDLVDDISCKYDGLITYSMGILTMIATSEFSEEFSPNLNEILQKLGSSTKIILLQNRLNKNISRFKIFNKKFLRFKHALIENDINNENIQNFDFSRNFNREYQLNYPPIIHEIHKFLYSNNQLLLVKLLKDLWDDYTAIYEEFIAVFIKLDQFLDNIVRDANNVSAKLFSKGFRASLPLYDIERCENAGIHIKHLVETSSSKKITIDDNIIDLKLKLFRKYENLVKYLLTFFRIKATEESSQSNLIEEKSIFIPMYNQLEKFDSDFKQLPILQGIREGILFACRFLFSTIFIFQNLIQVLKPYEKIIFNETNSRNFEDILQIVPNYEEKLRNLLSYFEEISRISFLLAQLNRNHVLLIAENPDYLYTPSKILNMIEDIPSIIKREFQQKLITKEIKDQKLLIYVELNKKIMDLQNIPIDHRLWVLPYSEDEYLQMSED